MIATAIAARSPGTPRATSICGSVTTTKPPTMPHVSHGRASIQTGGTRVGGPADSVSVLGVTDRDIERAWMGGVVHQLHGDRAGVRHRLLGVRLAAVVVLLPVDTVVRPDHEPQPVALPYPARHKEKTLEVVAQRLGRIDQLLDAQPLAVAGTEYLLCEVDARAIVADVEDHEHEIRIRLIQRHPRHLRPPSAAPRHSRRAPSLRLWVR